MFQQIGFMRELFVASDADVSLDGSVGRRVPGVRLHVSPQIRPIGKRLAAMRASVRLLTRVRSQVSLEQPRPGKGLAADVAFVTEIVR